LRFQVKACAFEQSTGAIPFVFISSCPPRPRCVHVPHPPPPPGLPGGACQSCQARDENFPDKRNLSVGSWPPAASRHHPESRLHLVTWKGRAAHIRRAGTAMLVHTRPLIASCGQRPPGAAEKRRPADDAPAVRLSPAGACARPRIPSPTWSRTRRSLRNPELARSRRHARTTHV